MQLGAMQLGAIVGGAMWMTGHPETIAGADHIFRSNGD